MLDAVFIVDKTIHPGDQIVIFMGTPNEVKTYLTTEFPAKMDRDQVMVSVGTDLRQITVDEYLKG